MLGRCAHDVCRPDGADVHCERRDKPLDVRTGVWVLVCRRHDRRAWDVRLRARHAMPCPRCCDCAPSARIGSRPFSVLMCMFVLSGTNTSNPFWNAISSVLSAPTAAQIACHAPKPILLNLEGISAPYPWAAQTVPLQVDRFDSIRSVGSQVVPLSAFFQRAQSSPPREGGREGVGGHASGPRAARV